MLLTLLVLFLNERPTAVDRVEAHQLKANKPVYSTNAPRFEQHQVKTNRRGERDWVALGRCDQASGRAWERLVRRKARIQGPSFAGRYSVVVCSCGTECGGLTIVDLKSGRVYDTPFALTRSRCISLMAEQKDFLRFRVDSSLLITVGDTTYGREHHSECAIRYYVWTGRRLRLIKKVPLRG